MHAAFTILCVVSAVVTAPARAQTPAGATSAIGDQKVGAGSQPKSARSDAEKKLGSQLLDEIARAKDSPIVSSVEQYDSTIAWVPVLMLERLASNPSVKAIQPAADAALQ